MYSIVGHSVDGKYSIVVYDKQHKKVKTITGNNFRDSITQLQEFADAENKENVPTKS